MSCAPYWPIVGRQFGVHPGGSGGVDVGHTGGVLGKPAVKSPRFRSVTARVDRGIGPRSVSRRDRGKLSLSRPASTASPSRAVVNDFVTEPISKIVSGVTAVCSATLAVP